MSFVFRIIRSIYLKRKAKKNSVYGLLGILQDKTSVKLSLEELNACPGETERNAFITAAREYAPWIDQWDRFTVGTEFGSVYVTIARSDPHPESFDDQF